MDIPGYVAFPQKPEVLKTKPEKKKKEKNSHLEMSSVSKVKRGKESI